MKVKTCLFATYATIFTRVISLKLTNEIWNHFKKEYAGDARIQIMQILNSINKFELKKMKESEMVKEYSNWLVNIVNKIQAKRNVVSKIKFVGPAFKDSRIVEKNSCNHTYSMHV